MSQAPFDFIQWAATLTGIAAATLVAAHISTRITGIAFIIFTVSSVLWVAFSFAENENGLLLQNVVLTAINLIGIYRYLLRDQRPSER
jgi:D-alanyl-lipoteichoic acid acyltransferase DltB (MBOAT superfamily)